MAAPPTLEELGILGSEDEDEGDGDRAAAGTRLASVRDAVNNSRSTDNVDEHDETPDVDDGNNDTYLGTYLAGRMTKTRMSRTGPRGPIQSRGHVVLT